MSASPLPPLPIQARALLIGRTLDPRRLEGVLAQALNPLVVPVAGGWAVLLRSGAVVLFDVDAEAESTFVASLRPAVKEPLDSQESLEREELTILVDPARGDELEQNRLVLPDLDPARLQAVADILGKSVLLASHEARVALVFDRIEPLARQLRNDGRGVRDARALLRHIGEALAIQHDLVGRGEVGDKPEVIWERPDLERLFLHLEADYEIRERQLALERKLTLIDDTAGTLLDLLQHQRSLRVEWYIVILIMVDIVISLHPF